MLILRYNIKAIGNRLKKERKLAGFKSMDALSDYIREHNYRGIKRQTIAKWEKGEEMPPLDVLCTLCVPFQCDLGYLLCEYDYKTRLNADIAEVTGLSEAAINNLKKFKRHSEDLEIIDRLLCSKEFEYETIDRIKKYRKSLLHCIKILNRIDLEMADFHTNYKNYTEKDKERYDLICSLERALVKELDTSQPLALWDAQKHFVEIVEDTYEKERAEIRSRYKHS